MQFCSLTDKAIPHRSKSLNLVPRREKGTLLQTLKHLEQKKSAHTKKKVRQEQSGIPERTPEELLAQATPGHNTAYQCSIGNLKR